MPSPLLPSGPGRGPLPPDCESITLGIAFLDLSRIPEWDSSEQDEVVARFLQAYYARVADRLVNVAPWGETSDREIRIRGRHSRQFYRHADELLRGTLDEIDGPKLVAAARTGLRATMAEVEA